MKRFRVQHLSALAKTGAGPRGPKERRPLEIFVAKFMNFLRNPYSVKESSEHRRQCPAFPSHRSESFWPEYNADLAGRKNPIRLISANNWTSAQNNIRRGFGVVHVARAACPKRNQISWRASSNRYSRVRPGFLWYAFTDSGEHADKRCLLSDRGYATPLPQLSPTSFSFNLSSTAFIVYLFASIEKLKLSYTPLPRVIDFYRTQQKIVRVVPFINDLAALARYNQNVVYQCHHAVYSSSLTGLTG